MRALILAQLEYGRAASPPEDAHALEPEAFARPGVGLFAAREGEAVLAIGALVRLDDEHGELKGMHTAAAARGRGLGRAILARPLAEARHLDPPEQGGRLEPRRHDDRGDVRALRPLVRLRRDLGEVVG